MEHPTCCIDGCDTTVAGLSDGWEYSRGLCCNDCIEFNARHRHWPDESPDRCVQCTIDDGGALHDCPESSIDVVISADGACPNCGITAEEVAADG